MAAVLKARDSEVELLRGQVTALADVGRCRQLGARLLSGWIALPGVVRACRCHGFCMA